MREKPPIRIGLIAAAVIGLALASVHYALLRTLRTVPIGPGLAFIVALWMIALALAALWLYGLVEMLSLRYRVDRNGVEIRTAFARQTIPHAAIVRIDPGESAGSPGRLRGLMWPGYMRGILRAAPYGQIAVWGTEPLERQLILVTADTCYAISPTDRRGFLERYALHKALGALNQLPHRLEPIGVASWSIWRDRTFWLAMALGFALATSLAALATVRYGTLPAIVPLHWNAQGQADRLAPRSEVFAIPAIGAAVLLVNLGLALALHQRERIAAQLLAWGSIAVQVGLWGASWYILGL